MSRKRKNSTRETRYDFFPDHNLTVFPNSNESQYESFQSLFAHIMSATSDRTPTEIRNNPDGP